MVHIAVLMMLKNESKRLNVTLDSIKNFADSLVIFDTGSTDDTIDICKNFSELYNIPLRLKQGEFTDFSESRNVSLDFADTFEDIDYLLLMDCNDELIGGDILRKFAEEDYVNNKMYSFLISQEWFSGTINIYNNIRFIKAHKGWRYKGVVHEYISITDKETKEEICLEIKKLDKNIKLYQDRTKDDDKSINRFYRDKELLLEEYKKNPKYGRTVFYLAQTFSCLNDYKNSYFYYKERTLLVGFWEETYESYFKCGELSETLNHDWHESFVWYIKAYESIPRVEPLLKIAKYYQNIKNFLLSYTFLDLACKLNFPTQCSLYVDKLAYDYTRWHLTSIVAYYTNLHYKEGKLACLRAIENGTKLNINTDIDKKNLEFYLKKEQENEKEKEKVIEEEKEQENENENEKEKEKEIEEKEKEKEEEKEKEKENIIDKMLTKNQFIKIKVLELKNTYPKASEKDLIKIAKSQWKIGKTN